MKIPSTLLTFLRQSGREVRVRSTQLPGASLVESAERADVPLHALVKAVAVRIGKTPHLAVLPATRELDVAALAAAAGRPVAVCAGHELPRLFPGSDPVALAPLSEAYGVQAIVDPTLDSLDEVFFASGANGIFLRASREEFMALQGECLRLPVTARGAVEGAGDARMGRREELRRQLARTERLPAMPGMALELIALKNNPFAGARELAQVIERDPSLSAQLIRYARSPFYAYRGEVKTVAQAITRVLGLDFVQHMALGIALGRGFSIPRGGPLGLDAFWRHALHCAALTQALATSMDRPHRPPRSMAWLAGLLHNVGLLLLGHLFRGDYRELEAAWEAEPERPLTALEAEALPMGHQELGFILMEAWRMPPEVIDAVHHHHDPDHIGPHAVYAQLVYVANALLRRRGIGDAPDGELPASLLGQLDLTEEKAARALDFVLRDEAGLGWMADAMAA